MTPQLSPALLVAAAGSFIGLGEDGGNNRGQMVEYFLREVKQPPGQPWCAAFVYHVGRWSHYDHAAGDSSWPLPATASCWELGDFARRHGILVNDPMAGDVFLVYHPDLRRFAHTGIVAAVQRTFDAATDPVHLCTTIEGNTSNDGSRNGTTTLRRERRFSVRAGDRFIRWVDLDGRALAA